MNSFRDFTKICRVCMSDGSRDIFHKLAASSNPSTSSTGTSPLDRLLEKLRYVTMMKIEENDDLPRLLCDLCIVQLNVAYNFKRQAVENDTKLRQYFIENGISSSCNNSAGSSNINNVTFNENQQNQSTRSSLTVSNISSIPVNRSFPIVPFIIKTEPSDNDALSDVTTEINLDTNRIESSAPSIQTGAPEMEIPIGNTDSGIELFNKDKHNSSVVYINGYGYNNLTPSSDIESVHNNHQNSMVNLSSSSQLLRKESMTSKLRRSSQQQRQRSQERQQTPQQQKVNDVTNRGNISVSNLSLENKNKNKDPPLTTPSKTTENNNISQKSRKGKFIELRNLSINMRLPSGKRRKTIEATTRNDTGGGGGGKYQSLKNELMSPIKKPLKGGTTKDVGKKCKPTRSQKEFLMNIGEVTSPPSSSLRKSNSDNSTSSSILVINPCSNSNPENVNEPRMRKRRLYNEGRVKEKTLTKFIRPKLEPTGK